MGLADIKARLAHIAGIDKLTVEQHADGSETYQLGNKGIRVAAGNAGIRNRVQILANHLVSPPEALAKVDQAVAAIGDPTPQIEVHKEITGRKPMSVTGIQSGAFQAKLAEMRQKIADKQNQALSKIDTAVTSGGAKMDAAVDDVIAKADKEVDAAVHEFAQFTNGPEA